MDVSNFLIDIAQIPIVHIHFKLRLTLEKDWERYILQGHSPLDFILKYRPSLICLSKSSKEKDIGDICPLFYVASSGFRERNYKIEIAFRETTSCTCHLVSRYGIWHFNLFYLSQSDLQCQDSFFSENCWVLRSLHSSGTHL